MDKDEVARKIMDYLRRNPDAGDTLEGISKWWLQSECIDQSVGEVSTALEELVKEGKLKKQKVKGERLVYKICKED